MNSGKSKIRPSRLSRWLIRKIFRDEEDTKLGDFTEIYIARVEDKGRIRARLWFWMYVLRSVPLYFRDSLHTAGALFNNSIRTALRNLTKHKAYSFINIAGLTIGLVSFILLSLYVQYEFSYDKFHTRFDRIYRVIQHQPEKNYMNSDYFAWTQGPLGPTLMEQYPEVTAAARMNITGSVLLSYGEKTFLENDFYFADPEIFEIFSLELIKGDPRRCLENPQAIIVSHKMAGKYFGNKDPIGQVIQGRNSQEYLVTGVLQDVPKNSHFNIEFLVPFKRYIETRQLYADTWSPGWYCYTYCLLQEGASADTLERKLVSLSAEVFEKNKIESRLVLQPLGRIHLHSNINGEISANGSIKNVVLFSSIAFLILLIACINYMNLGTARSVHRAKEVGIRKVVGARKGQLIRQFLGESLMLTALAFALSILVIQVVLPVFNAFFERNITLSLLTGMRFLPVMVALVLFTGIVSGSYPAFLISSFKPIIVLRGALSRSSQGAVLRRVLVVFQFGISTILIFSTLVVREQLAFIQGKDVGFQKDQIVVLRLRGGVTQTDLEALKTELLENPHILAAAGSSTLPDRITSFNRFPYAASERPLLTIYTGHIDYDFVDLYGLEIIEGRNFSREYVSDERAVILINETAARALEWESPVGKRLDHRSDQSPEVVGLLKDFNFHTLHNEIAPLCLYLDSERNYYFSFKISGDNIPETLKFVEGRIKTFSPEYPFEYRFFDDVFAQAYRAEQKMRTLFSVCAVTAVFIACLGLLGLVSFIAEQRTKEIGIRKVMGASASNIIRLLSRQLLKWVLLANIISWPIAYYAMHKWLQGFAYRVDLGMGVFLASALIGLGIALLTLSFKSVKAATANPVESLRYE